MTHTTVGDASTTYHGEATATYDKATPAADNSHLELTVKSRRSIIVFASGAIATGAFVAIAQYGPEQVEYHETQVTIRHAVAEPDFWLKCYAGNELSVRRFCDEHHLWRDAQIAVDLAKTHFGSSQLSASVEQDPESPDEWLVFDVVKQGSAEEVLEANRSFTKAWVRAVSPQSSGKIKVIYKFL